MGFKILLVVLSLSFITIAQDISGIYYIGNIGTGPNGSNPDFNVLSEAVNFINNGIIKGDCTFFITSSFRDSVNCGLGIDPKGFTITFKPYTGTKDTITFTQYKSNTGPWGSFLIGVKDISRYNTFKTRNIIIDGSNETNGNSRDLVLTSISNRERYNYPIRVFGDAANITIKNIKVVNKHNDTYALLMTSYYDTASAKNFCPDSILIKNCEVRNELITSGTAIGYNHIAEGNYNNFPDLIEIKDNDLYAKNRGIYIEYAGNTNIFRNEIRVNQTSSGFESAGIHIQSTGNAIKRSYVTQINSNKIVELKTTSNGDSTGISGIKINARGTVNIINNMITGFNYASGTNNASFFFKGLFLNSVDTTNVYHNTINLNLTKNNFTGGSQDYSGIHIQRGSVNYYNNIVSSNHKNDTTYLIKNFSSASNIHRNFNCYFSVDSVYGFIGYENTSSYPYLMDWQNNTKSDSSSIALDVQFRNINDLHLDSVLYGNNSLRGKYLSNVKYDIDGELRDTIFPYIGADENPDHPLPVTFSNFQINLINDNVLISWNTQTEINNLGFEIQKKILDGWQYAGFVRGAGSSSVINKYSFEDKMVYGTAYYRIKQMDYDGTYSYSDELVVENFHTPAFYLGQNYPNPFNPSTKIIYSVPIRQNVGLKVFDILGNEVETLINSEVEAGVHEVEFNANGLSSGIYFYQLNSNGYKVSKRMLLLK